MKKEIYNPVFESLLDTVKNYKPVYNYKIQEEEIKEFGNTDQGLKYFKMIFDAWINAIIYFSQSCPVPTIKKEAYGSIMESIDKLSTSNNSSIDSIIKVLRDSSKMIIDKINSQDKSSTIKTVYNSFKEGSELLDESYTAYQKRAGKMISDNELLGKVNRYVAEQATNIKKIAEEKK